MENGRIGPVHASAAFGGQVEGGYFPLHKAVLAARREQRRDEVDLTEPRRAVLTLLRERVLTHTRRALELPQASRRESRFHRIVGHDPKTCLARLLADQSALASQRRGVWMDAAIDSAIEQGLLEGMAETLEILHELDQLDADAWRLVCSLLDDFYRRCFDIDPHLLRQQIWDSL